MTVKNITNYINLIGSCMDFISANSDSDITGISNEMMNGLSEMRKDLLKHRNKQILRTEITKAIKKK